MNFCQKLWSDNQDIITQIIDMPFVQEMYHGTLDKTIFHYYIEQDIHYLNNYTRCSAFLAGKSDTLYTLKLYLKIANLSFEEQKRIHEVYTKDPSYYEQNSETPALKNYSAFMFLLATTRPNAIAWAGMLPCPLLYIYLGKYFSERGLHDNDYRIWFEGNCHPEVVENVREQRELLNQYANYHPEYHAEMAKVFREALFFEYEFWDDVYNKKSSGKIN